MERAMSFIGTHQILEYTLRINEAVNPPFLLSRIIRLKLEPLAHNMEPEVVIHFDPTVTKMFGSVVKGNIFDAQIAVALNESRFDDIYAVLRSERPVYFDYVAEADWSNPLDPKTLFDVSSISIYVGNEPVGEAEQTESIQALRGRNVLADLRAKVPGTEQMRK
jgi:hypothetical protein